MEVLFVVALLAKLVYDAIAGIIAQVKADQINRAYRQLRDNKEDNGE